MQIRPADIIDSDEIYEINSHPIVRTWCLNPEPFALSQHQVWYKKALSERGFYVIEDCGNIVCTCNLRKFRAGKEVSIATHPIYHGKGYGLKMLEHIKGIENDLWAMIDIENSASIGLFKKAGFEIECFEPYENRNMVWYVFKKPC